MQKRFYFPDIRKLHKSRNKSHYNYDKYITTGFRVRTHFYYETAYYMRCTVCNSSNHKTNLTVYKT